MGFVKTLLINLVDPFGLLRKVVVQPALGTAALFGLYDERAASDDSCSGVAKNNASARDIAVKATFLAFATAVIIWMSIFMYIAFYYTYMPAIEHIRPVHIQFDACNSAADGNELSQCNFPHAFVPLTRRQQLLMVGQPYKVYVYLEMPESPVNQELGMFMVCADMRDETTELLNHSCRSAMLHYKSSLVQMIKTWILSPLYVFGFHEETQKIAVELFTNYEEDQTRPVRDVYVEIQSRKIQFYSVTLHIVAHFTGLRYIMFHWPLLSASVGICTNLFFIMIVSILSWYHWGDAVWIERNAKDRPLKRSIRSKHHIDTESSTSVDESNNILDDDDLINMEQMNCSSRTDDEDIDNVSGDGVENRRLGNLISQSKLRNHKITSKKDS